MAETLILVDNVKKKFCRRLRRSLWYGMVDLGAELFGRNNSHRELRKEEFWAVEDISFELKKGNTIGLIGPNGSGKTTLLRMLNGLIKPDAGRIRIVGNMQALIALGAGFNPILTGRENIYVNASVLGLRKIEVDKKFKDIVEFSGIEDFIDTPLQSYSSGMAVRLGFAVAAHLDPDILLVDEVLAVGDHGFQMKCLNKIGELKKKGTGIILVSHNMHTISTYASAVLLLNKGKGRWFDEVSGGINEYQAFFSKSDENQCEKVCSGNDHIRFFQVDIPKTKLSPGESFSAILRYKSDKVYDDVEIDLGIYSSRETFFHFQATNKAYEESIHLRKGQHNLALEIENIRINNAMGRVAIAIWTNNRTELLFWWRIPVEFSSVDHSTGNSFLNARFEMIPE